MVITYLKPFLPKFFLTPIYFSYYLILDRRYFSLSMFPKRCDSHQLLEADKFFTRFPNGETDYSNQ